MANKKKHKTSKKKKRKALGKKSMKQMKEPTEKKRKKRKKLERPLRPELLELLGRFGPYLNARRTEKGWPLRDLAEKASCAHTNIFQFENTGKNPTLTELAALATAFKETLTGFLRPLAPPVAPAAP